MWGEDGVNPVLVILWLRGARTFGSGFADESQYRATFVEELYKVVHVLSLATQREGGSFGGTSTRLSNERGEGRPQCHNEAEYLEPAVRQDFNLP